MRGPYIECNDGNTKYDDPDRDVEVVPPVGNEDTGHCQVVRQHDHILKEVVPSSRETTGGLLLVRGSWVAQDAGEVRLHADIPECWINKARSITREALLVRQPCTHLTKCHHDDIDDEAHEDIPNQHGSRASVLERSSGSDNQTCTNSTSNSHLVSM